MNLLITGGTGFFGRALIKHLEAQRLADGGSCNFEQVTVLSRSPEKFCLRYPALAKLPWIAWHPGDVLRPESLPQQRGFDHILHAAADSTDAAGLTPLQTYRQIVVGTENMLNFAIQHGTQRFLFISSGGVYGPQPADLALIPESFNRIPDPLSVSSTYGIAKRQAEHLCTLYGQQFGLETVIARCFAFVGEDLPMNAHFAIGNFIRDALKHTEITVNGNGSPIRSYLHQSDLAHWLITLLRYGVTGNAYNVGSDESISILELANLVRELLSPHKQVNILAAPNSTTLRNRFIPDIAKAREDLGLLVTINLKNAIRLAAKDVSTDLY